MFSKACEYGIRATLFIAQKSRMKERVSLKDIAWKIGSPEAFTAKILQQLAKSNVLDSVKGPMGGFQIAVEKIEVITLGQIVAAIDGDSIYKGCGLGLPACDAARPCPLHDKFVAIRSDLKAMLENTTLRELTKSLDNGLACLKR